MRRLLVIALLFFGGFLFSPVYAAANVTFDSQGTWIIDGKRLFLYGTFQLPRPKGTGILDSENWDRMANYYHLNNTIIEHDGSGGIWDNGKRDLLAAQYNVYLTQGNPWISEWPDWNNPTAKAYIKDQISRPRRIMFYGAEEASIARENLFLGYDYLKQTYPNVPIHLNFINISLIPYHTNLVNFITRTKASVISSHRNDNTTHTAQTKTLVQLREEIPTVKSAYLLIRGWTEYGGGGKDPDIGFKEDQMEFDVFNSIALGINGIMFWELPSNTPHPYYGGKYGEVIARIGGYLEEIAPGLVAPNRIYKTDHIVSKGEDNRYYVIATPNSTTSFTVTGLPKNTVFERLFYGTGTITTNANGQFTDTTGGKIKIYRQKVAPSTPIPIPGDITETGDKVGDHVNINDYNLLVTKFGIPYTIFDYNLIVENWNK